VGNRKNTKFKNVTNSNGGGRLLPTVNFMSELQILIPDIKLSDITVSINLYHYKMIVTKNKKIYLEFINSERQN